MVRQPMRPAPRAPPALKLASQEIARGRTGPGSCHSNPEPGSTVTPPGGPTERAQKPPPSPLRVPYSGEPTLHQRSRQSPSKSSRSSASSRRTDARNQECRGQGPTASTGCRCKSSASAPAAPAALHRPRAAGAREARSRAGRSSSNASNGGCAGSSSRTGDCGHCPGSVCRSGPLPAIARRSGPPGGPTARSATSAIPARRRGAP
mmetsp:Transcript_34700/g.95942  ORF Transcript_34700/g.95942 Transcript_34700/m.95942 type:complete len:206 (+) Transcript_34700:452-1069(+)